MINERNLSKTSTEKTARVSLISEDEQKMNDQDNSSTPYHILNLKGLKYWMIKVSNSIFFMIQKMKKNYEEIVQEYNNLVQKNNEYEEKFQKLEKRYQLLTILKQKTRNDSIQSVKVDHQANTITKKFSNPSIFIDDKDSVIDEWLSIMRNKMKVNENWYFTKTMKKAYIRIRLEDDAMKHLVTWFKKDSIKSFDSAEDIFDELNRIFDDLNKRMNAMKAFRRLKQLNQYKEFHIFWFEFQRLVSDAKVFDELVLLEDLKNMMSFELQKTLASEAYKVTDLHEFARLCQFIDQTLRDVRIKSTRDRNYEYKYISADRGTITIT